MSRYKRITKYLLSITLFIVLYTFYIFCQPLSLRNISEQSTANNEETIQILRILNRKSGNMVILLDLMKLWKSYYLCISASSCVKQK